MQHESRLFQILWASLAKKIRMTPQQSLNSLWFMKYILDTEGQSESALLLAHQGTWNEAAASV